jgi:drug/metabolite transporter (DMT)-like permease
MFLYTAVQKLRAITFVLLSFLYPLTALLFDVVVYDLRPSLIQLLGMCLILLAVAGEKFGYNKKQEDKVRLDGRQDYRS